MIDFLEIHQFENRFDNDFVNRFYLELEKSKPSKISKRLSDLGIQDMYVINNIHKLDDEYYDMFFFKTNHFIEDKTNRLLLLPLLKFRYSDLRIDFELTTYEFNKLSGGINQTIIEKCNYSKHIEENIILFDFEYDTNNGKESDTIREIQNGDFNYDKYLQIIPGKGEIYVLQEFEKWYNDRIIENKKQYFEGLFKNDYSDLDTLYSLYFEKKKVLLDEKIDEWEELKGIYFDGLEEERQLKELNEDGLSDFGETGYWNTD